MNVIIFLLLGLVGIIYAENSSILLCHLLPLSRPPVGYAARLFSNITQAAVDAINKQGLIPNHTLLLQEFDTSNNSTLVVNEAFQCATQYNCTGVLGGATSEHSELIQYVLANFGIPQISYFSTETRLSNKITYPTFLRTIASETAVGPAVAQIIQHFGWTQVNTVIASDPYSIAMYQEFYQASLNFNFTITVECFLEPVNPHYALQVQKLRAGYVQIFVIFAMPEIIQEVLHEAARQEILGPDSGCVWIGGQELLSINAASFPNNTLRGTLAVTPLGVENTTLAQQYLQKFARVDDAGGDAPLGGFAYDAVYTYAYALRQLFNTTLNSTVRGGTPWKLPGLLNALLNTNFTGVSGQVSFNASTGDRIGYEFSLMNFQNTSVSSVARIVGTQIFPTASVTWADGSTIQPEDTLVLYLETSKAIRGVFFVLETMILLPTLILPWFLWRLRTPKKIERIEVVMQMLSVVFGAGAIFTIYFKEVSEITCTTVLYGTMFSFLLYVVSISYSNIRRTLKDLAEYPEKRRKLSYLMLVLLGTLMFLVIANLTMLVIAVIPEKGLIPVATHSVGIPYYEQRCYFSTVAFIMIPICIGLLLVFSSSLIVWNMISKKHVAIRNWNIVLSVSHIVVLLAFEAAVAIIAFMDTNQTNIEVAICFMVLAINGLVPINISLWLRRVRRRRARARAGDALVHESQPLINPSA